MGHFKLFNHEVPLWNRLGLGPNLEKYIWPKMFRMDDMGQKPFGSIIYNHFIKWIKFFIQNFFFINLQAWPKSDYRSTENIFGPKFKKIIKLGLGLRLGLSLGHFNQYYHGVPLRNCLGLEQNLVKYGWPKMFRMDDMGQKPFFVNHLKSLYWMDRNILFTFFFS